MRKKRRLSNFESLATCEAPQTATGVQFPPGIEDTESSDATSIPSLTEIIQEMVSADLASNPVGQQPVGAISNDTHLIPLSDLFDYSVPVDLACWNGGVRQLDEEMALYDLGCDGTAAMER